MIRTTRSLLILLVMWRLSALPGSAQQLPAMHYTIRDGLAQMQGTAILKDSRGYIWVGTKNGLSKFDGERFDNFTTRDGLLTNRIDKMVEDPKGYIWISNVRGIVRFDGKTFTPFKPADSTMTFSGLWLDSDGTPLIQARNKQGQQLLRLQEGRFSPLISLILDPQLGDNQTIMFVDTARQRVCITIEKKGSTGQLWWYQNGTLTPWKDSDNGSYSWTYRGPMADGTPILSSLDTKTTRLRTYYFVQNERMIPFFRTDDKTQTVLNPVPADCVVETDKRYFLLEKNSTRLIPLPLPATRPCHYVFDKGGLWCVTEKGLYHIWNNGFRYFSEEQVPYCWGVVEDQNQHLWFQNYGNSLMRFDGQTVTRISGYEKVVVDKNNNLPDEWYYHPIRDQYGHLWLTNYAGAIRYDGRQFIRITDPTQAQTTCLIEDPARNLILKGGENHVLFIENRPPFRFTCFDWQPDGNATDKFVQVMRKDLQGFYWFGGHHLTRYDYDRKKATVYSRQTGKFPAQNVLGMCIDNRQNLWVASENGLLLYDRSHDRFQVVLSDSVVSKVTVVGQFDKDHILFGDMKNLYIMDLAHFYRTRQVRCKVFNPFNGFMGLEPKQDGYYQDSRGYIWITSGSVLSRLDPERIDLSTMPLLTYVTKVNEQRLAFVGETTPVDLIAGENSATFTMATIGDDRPFFTEYSYRVAGFVDAWSPWQTQNLITLTNLPGGDYTIQIRSRSGSFGIRQPAETTLSFRVSLPFWKAPNFYQKALLALSMVIGLMGVDWYLKQRRIRRQQQAIQDRERQVQFLQVQTMQAQMNPHFIFNVLGTIQHLIVANDTEQAAANLLKLSHLMRNYLEASMLSNEEHGSLFSHEVPLAREIELLTMYIDFEKLQYGDRFTHEIVVTGKLNPESYQVPPLILQPYVENAIKHGFPYAEQTGHLRIRFATIDEEVLICTIEDNGVGRQRAHELQQSSLKKYRSRGTELVERRVELLNQMGYAISIETTDRPTGGTVVTIHIGYKLDSTPEQP